MATSKQQPFISRRAQVFWMGFGMVIFLLCWTVPAQWEHINSLQPEYATMAKIGALSPEFAIFCFLLFHSWDRSLTVRKCALIFGGILAALVLVHGAGLWGMKDGKVRQEASEDRLTEKLSEYGKSVAEANENKRPMGRQITRAEVREQGRVAKERDKNAQALINQSVNGRTDAIQKASFLSKEYMDGPMYAVNFIAALILTSILTWLHFNPKIDDIDEDGDGVADIKQGKVVNLNGQDYAINPNTGQPDPQWAEFMKSRDMGQLFKQWESQRNRGPEPERQMDSQGAIPAPSPLRGGRFNSDGAIDIQPESKPQPEPEHLAEPKSGPIQTGPWAKPQNGKAPKE